MNIHEYQAKSLLAKYGVSVPTGIVVKNAEEAKAAFDKLAGDRLVVKAQVHAGGRGKAGGVVLLDNKDAIADKVSELIGTNLVTFQTDDKGQPINSVWIEEASDIANELYLSAVIDRSSGRLIFMASTEGGMEIEEVAEKTPEKIYQVMVEPMVGMQPFQARQLFFAPRSALLPCKRTTTGTSIPTCFTAAIIPSAIRSQRTIPPKILTRIPFTFGSEVIILKASVTRSSVAPPPTSKKLAGSPPLYLIRSIVAMAKPAPLTIQPISPSKEI
jgi:hypothetical protein